MIMSKVADSLLSAFSPSSKINIVQVEVTDSARELERSHLCGPTAGLIQAEALVGVSLLGAQMTLPDETVTLRMKVSGPIGGVLVEASSDGGLRGYTQVKVMNELDACEELDASAALGEMAEFQIVRSVLGKVLASGATDVSPASVIRGLEQYFRLSLQRQVLVQISALAYGGFIDCARGVLIECLPDGNREVFSRIGQFVDDGTVLECLESSASLETVCETLGLADCTFQKPKPLFFSCRCSQERVEAMLSGMPNQDLEALVLENRPAQIFCHMCGKGYQVEVDRIGAILRSRN
jgi:molecular chaperone Hsp33